MVTEILSLFFYRCQFATKPALCSPWVISTPRFLNRNLKQGMLQKELKSDTDSSGHNQEDGITDTGSLAHTRGIPYHWAGEAAP